MGMKPSLSLLSLSSPFATLLRPREFRLLLSLGALSHLFWPVVVVFLDCAGSFIVIAFALVIAFASITGEGDISAAFVGCVWVFSWISMDGSAPEMISPN